MKKFLTKKGVLIGAPLGFLLIFIIYLFADLFYVSNFRTMQDPLTKTDHVNLTGLRELQASGGAPLRFSELQNKLQHVKGPKYIVDGMAEFHGYIKGIPTTFFGYQRRGPNFRHLMRRWILTGTSEINPAFITSEETEAKNHGFDYKKVNIGSTFIPADENIDEIVTFFDITPQDAWFHFHCAQGKGRTSMLLVMLDIMKNAPQVAFEDIIKRQHLLGSEDLLSTVVWKKGSYTKEQLEERKEFIQKFYDFVAQRKAGGTQRWSEWNPLQK
jgi:hypothetical protein